MLAAPWKKIVCTPVDISVKTKITDAMVADIKKSNNPVAQYVVKFFMKDQGGFYMWDELAAAAWIDPTLITKKVTRYMSVNIDHGAGYGGTLTWTDRDKPQLGERLVEIQMDLGSGRGFNQDVCGFDEGADPTSGILSFIVSKTVIMNYSPSQDL